MSSPTVKETNKEEFEAFIKNITKPRLLSSLTQFTLTVETDNGSFTLDLYGFNTISDLKLAIYQNFKQDYAAPNNQFLYIKLGPRIQPIDFVWVDRPLLPLPNNEINMHFISAEGLPTGVKNNNYNDLLLESKLREPKIYLKFFKDIYNAIPGPRPLTDKQYYGIIYPYFPYLQKDVTYPNEEQEENLENIVAYYNKKKEYLSKIVYLLEEGGYEFVVPIFNGIRYLRLTWPVNNIEDNIDSYFYTIDVNEDRPYLRLLPVGSTPISKILFKEDEDIPNISNLSYLDDWSSEKNPTPDRDYIYGKIALKSTIANLPYIYATLRILDDGSFDITVEPPTNIRKIDINTDIEDFSSSIINGIGKINSTLPVIGSGNFIYGLKLQATSQILTRKNFEKRIQVFKHIFQEIAPLPNEQPFYMLRYKLVDNFTTEDNISNYLTQISNKKLLKGDIKPEDLVTLLAEEFKLDNETAQNKVQKWYKQKSELQQIVVGETKAYAPLNNSGVDIAIFQTKNLYTFHLYNINSINTLRTILTCLSLIFAASDEDLSVSKSDIRVMKKIENAISLEEEQEEKEEDEVGSLTGFDQDILFGMTEDTSNVESIREQLLTNAKEEHQQMPYETESKEDKEEDKGVANFFIRKLKEVDRSLFDYVVKGQGEKSKNGDYKKVKEKSYVQMCAANELRQPAVLTQEQYEGMIEEYQYDDVQFQLYPLAETIDEKGRRKKEVDVVDTHSDPDKIVTILRYGSNPLKENYYVCGEYFCTRDEIILLKHDFVGTKLRRPIVRSDGSEQTTKQPNTCPFCLGTLISNKRNPDVNETVIQRVYKPKTLNKKHYWINFLKKTSPSGLKLPCCFIKPSTIEFKDIQSGFVKKEDDEEEFEMLESGVPIFDYVTTLSRIQKKYIVGEVLPLEIGERDGPQIGLLPGPLNAVFQQDPNNIVGRIGNLQKILPDATGFLRIGVENRKRYMGDSFLAAIAPFFFKNSALQMKQRLLEVITPRVFIQLNYGNLLLEFYSPNDPVLPKQLLQRWANNNLGISYSDTNRLEIERAYKSYTAFIHCLQSDDKKEYRQFAMVLAQTNLVQGNNRPGTTFIVIDLNEDSSVSIRCPTYGYNTELMTNNDVAFLFHHHTGIWEPIFYVDNVVTGLQVREPFNLLFQKGRYDSWPLIVKSLLSEFTRKCEGPGKTLYTPQSHIKSDALIPLSYAKNMLQNISQKYSNFFFVGLLRDSYNHIAAIVCEEKRSEKSFKILLPVIDDGILITNKDIYVNYEDIEPESYDNTIRIYNKYILPYFTRYPGYKPANIAKSTETQMYVGIQLKNNLYIPIEETKSVTSDLKPVEISEFEWDINRSISFENEEESKEIEKKIMEENDINEVYEHLRITFGNYLANKGSNIIYYLENDIIFNTSITLSEKRNRMIRLLGSLILSWFSTETQEKSRSLLRKDCLIQTQSTCNDKCVWTSNNTCKIHVKEKFMNVNMANLLMLRLFDEILRYSEKRKQLFNNDISRLVFLNEAIRIGNQYIVPENTLEWTEILRSIWAERKSEAARFFEEFSSQLVEKEETANEIDGLIFNKITADTSLSPIINYLGLNDLDIKYDGDASTFTIKQLMDMGTLLKSYVIQADMRVEPPQIKHISTLSNRKPSIVILLTNEGSGVLTKNGKEKIVYEDLPKMVKP